ncbi:hypothetical protein LJB87_00690 [Alistipes sp. OttesenSCG-928-L06]|nr:hypothetical protein [Alistipes sp. OttesenSCG-928-L06]
MNKLWYIGLLLGLLLVGCRQRVIPSNADLSKLESPVLFAGDSLTAYRDPAILFHDNRFYLFFAKSEIIGDSVFCYLVQSESDDLMNWTEPRRIVPNSPKNYSAPGSVIRYKDEWVVCLHSYPRPGHTVDQMPRYADNSARLYTIRSKDLRNWSEPELIRVKGNIPEKDMGRMIDPYIVADKEEAGKWWCFYKQSGVSMSYSYDLKNWTPYGAAHAGESVCVLAENNEYILFHCPYNGIRIKKSRSLQNWTDWGGLITLGQKDWEWAKGRITAGKVINLNNVQGVNAYVMFFHGSGPGTEHEGDFDRNSSIGIAWSRDLVRWNWPGKNQNQ